jgi:ATP-binding cassette subfamily C protein LapB
MKELLARLFSRPILMLEMTAASFLANILALASPIFVMQVLNRYVAHGVDATLATLTAGVCIAILFELAFRRIRFRLATSINSAYDRVLSNGAFGSLTTTKTIAFEMLPMGLRQEMVGGAEKIQSAYNANNLGDVFDVPFAFLFIGVLFLLNPTIAIVVTGFVVFGFLISLLSLFSLRRPTKAMQNAASLRSGMIGSAIQAGETVRAFNGGSFLRRQWEQQSSVFQKLFQKISGRQGFTQSFSATIQAVMGVAVIAIGGIQVVAGNMDLGVMIGANILASRALGPVLKFAMMSEQMAKAREALALFQEFSKLPREKTEGTALSNYSGSIVFDDMAFTHPGAKTPLFESVNLTLEPASTLVFSGSNGSGKTTMARLLAGLLEPTRGRILVDSVDLSQIAPEWWRTQIMYLPQEPKFLDGTLAENITLTVPDCDEARLRSIVEMAGLRSFVDQSSDGMDTPIIGGGKNLSLGIRRRIALARALASGGKVMLIDEPTEGLDNEGCQAVLESINTMSKNGCTVLIFSHDQNLLASVPHYVDLNVKPVPNLIRRPTAAPSDTKTAVPTDADEPSAAQGVSS